LDATRVDIVDATLNLFFRAVSEAQQLGSR